MLKDQHIQYVAGMHIEWTLFIHSARDDGCCEAGMDGKRVKKEKKKREVP